MHSKMRRTTVLLDGRSERAAKVLAAHLNVSPSEAMRRALLHYEAQLIGTPAKEKSRRRELLHRLIEISSDTDAEEEILRRKQEDEHW